MLTTTGAISTDGTSLVFDQNNSQVNRCVFSALRIIRIIIWIQYVCAHGQTCKSDNIHRILIIKHLLVFDAQHQCIKYHIFMTERQCYCCHYIFCFVLLFLWANSEAQHKKMKKPFQTQSHSMNGIPKDTLYFVFAWVNVSIAWICPVMATVSIDPSANTGHNQR